MARPTSFVVKLTDNSGAWFQHKQVKINKALEAMGNSVAATAQMTAPKLHNNLAKSGQVKKYPSAVAISFGGSLGYGSYQERGMRADGTRVVKKYTTPNTGAHYLENAGKTVVKKGITWLLSRS